MVNQVTQAASTIEKTAVSAVALMQHHVVEKAKHDQDLAEAQARALEAQAQVILAKLQSDAAIYVEKVQEGLVEKVTESVVDALANGKVSAPPRQGARSDEQEPRERSPKRSPSKDEIKKITDSAVSEQLGKVTTWQSPDEMVRRVPRSEPTGMSSARSGQSSQAFAAPDSFQAFLQKTLHKVNQDASFRKSMELEYAAQQKAAMSNNVRNSLDGDANKAILSTLMSSHQGALLPRAEESHEASPVRPYTPTKADRD